MAKMGTLGNGRENGAVNFRTGSLGFLLRFSLLYVLLIVPWPGLGNAIASYVRDIGCGFFGESVEHFKAGLKKLEDGRVRSDARHIVLFRQKSTMDKALPPEVDIVLVFYNADNLKIGKPAGLSYGLESKTQFWLPFAFYLALVGSSPIRWQRKIVAVGLGLALAHLVVVLTLWAYVLSFSASTAMIEIAPWWEAMLGRILVQLIVASGPSIISYFVLWPIACFRPEELRRIALLWRGRELREETRLSASQI